MHSLCPADHVSNHHQFYSVVNLGPTPFSSCLVFPPHFFLFLDGSTSQSLPSETSPLLSNGKSISQFVKVALVLSLCLFIYSLTQSHTHTNTVTYTVIRLPSLPTNTVTNSKRILNVVNFENLSEKFTSPFHPIPLKDTVLQEWNKTHSRLNCRNYAQVLQCIPHLTDTEALRKNEEDLFANWKWRQLHLKRWLMKINLKASSPVLYCLIHCVRGSPGWFS